jgi:orotate phosphoribosyltransferase
MIMSQGKALGLLENTGAVLSGHFCLTRKEAPTGKPDGWFHSRLYVNKATVCTYPFIAMQIAEAMIDPFLDDSIEIIASPAVGAVALGAYAALAFESETPSIRFVYAERKGEGGKMSLERGFAETVKGRRVLVVEDIITSGGSVIETIKAVEAAGGYPVGVSVLWNRGGTKAQEEVFSNLRGGGTFFSLIQKEITTNHWTECPECALGVPLDMRVGKAMDFLEGLPLLTLLTIGRDEQYIVDKILAANK